MNRRNFLHSALAAAVAAAIPGSAAWAALTEVVADIAAVTGDRRPISIEKAAVQELADSLRGNLLLPGNAAYEKARRVLNGSIDRHPAFVIQPIGTTDIRNAVNFAREREMLLAVKCGGHSYSGSSTCDGGMQIDLSTFRHTRVDTNSRTAFVAGGSLLGELDRETMAVGLVTTAGTVSHTGVGGLTLGGGFGRLARRFGLSLDNLKAVDIVTADGQLRHASADENPDLFWGVRGGGGNFGVVTAFDFQLHPMQRQVVGGNIFFPISKLRDLLNFYSEYVHTAPDDLYCDVLALLPPGGQDSVCGFNVCYSGAAEKADAVLAPIRKLGTPIVDTVAAIDYVDLQRSGDDNDPRQVGEYLKSGFINEIPGALIDELVAGFEPHPDRHFVVLFQHSGGAIGRVASDATAFAHRKSAANLLCMLSWELAIDGAPHIAYLKDFWSKVERFTDGYYTNEVSNEPQAQVNSNYQGNFGRLLEVKQKYDPTNLFRLNANIAAG
ncbi:MAG: FAD-binding protein [Gammaproteobacteria bacterium]|nr:FAD-binding protein [Gammaproteobacteria bacterium]MDH5321562.1 FAD-binding protein [Gammaproteobacteria bacterium]